MTDQPNPARTLYTAQEIADLALRWGAAATISRDDHEVVIDLERRGESMQLMLGRPQDFYNEMICRSWIFVESAPHRACDRWNELPYFGTFSVVYDSHDSPMVHDLGFVVRGVRLIEFDRVKSEDDIRKEVIHFWFAMALIQDLVLTGSTDLTQIDRLTIPGALTRWWLGDEIDEIDDIDDDEVE